MNSTTSILVLGEDVQCGRFLIDSLKTFAAEMGMTFSIAHLSHKHTDEILHAFAPKDDSDENVSEQLNIYFYKNIEMHPYQEKTTFFLTREELPEL